MENLIVDGWDLVNEPTKPWLAQDLLRSETFAVLSGLDGSYKSFLALDLAYCVAEGRPFFGKETKQGDVLYILGERAGDQKHRLIALEKTKRVELGAVRFIKRPYFFDLAGDEDEFVEAIDTSGMRPRLIIIDTLRRNFSGGENSNDDMDAFVKAVDRVKVRYGATMLVLHHVNKKTGQLRGASCLSGAIDTDLYCTVNRSNPKKPVLTMRTRKQSNGGWQLAKFRPTIVPTEHKETSVVLDLVHWRQANSVDDLEEAEQVSGDDPRFAEIITILGNASEPMGHNQLNDATSFRRQDLRAVLDTMESLGLVVMTPGPRNSQLYALPATGSETSGSHP